MKPEGSLYFTLIKWNSLVAKMSSPQTQILIYGINIAEIKDHSFIYWAIIIC